MIGRLLSEVGWIVLRFAAAFPACLCLYSWTLTGLWCFARWEGSCIMMPLAAPIFIWFGPIAHDETDPPNHRLAILAASITVTVIWTAIARAYRKRTSTSDQGQTAKG